MASQTHSISARTSELEEALCEASNMAGVTMCFIAEGLTFSSNKVPELTPRHCELLYYALSRTTDLIDEAKRVFYDYPS